eukprot:gene22195-23263_t
MLRSWRSVRNQPKVWTDLSSAVHLRTGLDADTNCFRYSSFFYGAECVTDSSQQPIKLFKVLSEDYIETFNQALDNTIRKALNNSHPLLAVSYLSLLCDERTYLQYNSALLRSCAFQKHLRNVAHKGHLLHQLFSRPSSSSPSAQPTISPTYNAILLAANCSIAVCLTRANIDRHPVSQRTNPAAMPPQSAAILLGSHGDFKLQSHYFAISTSKHYAVNCTDVYSFLSPFAVALHSATDFSGSYFDSNKETVHFHSNEGSFQCPHSHSFHSPADYRSVCSSVHWTDLALS